MSEPDIDDLFDRAAGEGRALDDLEDALARVREAQEAKSRLARLDTAVLRAGLARRAQPPGLESA